MKKLNFQKIILIIFLINISINQLFIAMENKSFPLSNDKYYERDYKMNSLELDIEKLFTEKISQCELNDINNIKVIEKFEVLCLEFFKKNPKEIINDSFNFIINDSIDNPIYNQMFNIYKFHENSLSNIKKNKINIDHPEHNKISTNIQDRIDFDLIEYKKLNKTLVDPNVLLCTQSIKIILNNIITIVFLSSVLYSNLQSNSHVKISQFLKSLISSITWSHNIDEKIKEQYLLKINEIQKILETEEGRANIISKLKKILKDFFPKSELCKMLKRKNIEQYIKNHPLEALLNIDFFLFNKDYNVLFECTNIMTYFMKNNIYDYHYKPFFLKNNIRKELDSNKIFIDNIKNSVLIFCNLTNEICRLLKYIIKRGEMFSIDRREKEKLCHFILKKELYLLYKKDKRNYKFEREVKNDIKVINKEQIQYFQETINNRANECYPLKKYKKLLLKSLKKYDKPKKINARLYQYIVEGFNAEYEYEY